MDWDSLGAFALFASGGAIGVGLIFLRVYALNLKSKLDWEKIRAGAKASDEMAEQLQVLSDQVERLTERADFTERLLGPSEQTGQERDQQGKP